MLNTLLSYLGGMLPTGLLTHIGPSMDLDCILTST